MVPMMVLLVSACEQPTDVPEELGPSYGTTAGPYVDLGLRQPRPTASSPALAPGTSGSNAVLNGSFEVNDGPGSTTFADWGTFNRGSGAVFAQTGTDSPISGFVVPSPPDGDFAAMVDQFGPGLHILYQDVVVPRSADLSFDLYVGNRAGEYATPNSLSPDVFPNQQVRVDIMDPAVPIDDVGAGVLANVFQTLPGDPPESGYDRIVYDMSAFEGQTVRIRFASVDNLFFLQVGIDDVMVGRDVGGDPVGPPTHFTSIDVVELVSFPVFVPCAVGGIGELVLLDGSLQFLFHFSEDQAGGFHVKSESNPQDVSGFGQTSGHLYQGTGATGSQTNFTISGVPFTDSFVNNFRIIGQGPGNNFLVHTNAQFTVNANGVVTVSNINFMVDCK